jgi:FixJ family two-component response regulator
MAMEPALPAVAVVDDDESVRRALVRVVMSLSYEPVGFASGEEFLASFASAIPECAILDFHMPGLNGEQVLDEMRRREIDLPVIMVTAFDRPGMCRTCLDGGAVAYLIKPFETSELSYAIKYALRGELDAPPIPEGKRQ